MPLPPRGYMRLAVSERGAETDREQTYSSERLAYSQRADILKWFQKSDVNDVTWVLERLTEIMPHLMHEAVSQKTATRDQSFGTTQSTNGVARTPSNNIGDPFAGDPIIQFTSSMYYAAEGADNVMNLDVMRIGNLQGTSEVDYETEDDSALSGRSYVATSGTLLFKPGESCQQIKVVIINNTLWDTTTEFKCCLKHDSVKGAILGQYLYHTRVRILNNNFFPTDDFEHLNTQKAIHESPKWPLLFGYFRLVSNIPRVWGGTVKYILIDTFHNAWFLLQLFMNVYILDYIVDTSCPDSDLFLIHDKRESLLACAAITVGATALGHALDHWRMELPIVGPTRNFVQNALLRKFLNYKTFVRERLAVGRVIQGIESDANDMVCFGYLNMLQIISAVGKMICMGTFKLTAPLIFGGNLDPKAFLLLPVTPFLMIVFLWLRENTTHMALNERNEAHSEVTNQISIIIGNFHLVIDYSLRNFCEYKMIEKQKRYGAAIKGAVQVLQNNTYFCRWCQSLVIAIWILYGGLHVVDGSLTLGFFVTYLQLFDAAGKLFLELYSLVVGMMNTFPAVENVTTLMNHPVDVRQRYELKRMQQSMTKQIGAMLHKKGPHSVEIDMMPIVLKFEKPFKFECKDHQLNFRGHVELHQGQLVALVGSLGSGKATLLRLITGSVLPGDTKESPVFVPSHLRIANVADEPLFFGGTLYESLIFGLDPDGPDASHERVKSICKRLTRSHTITDYLDRQEDFAWKDIFSVAQCKLLAIARALIHNYEVLCIHKPLARLTNDDAEHVIAALHHHVESKGLELPSDSAKRRPRTVIVSAATDRAIQEAHNVIRVDAISGIQLLDKETVQGGRHRSLAHLSSIERSISSVVMDRQAHIVRQSTQSEVMPN